MDQNRNGHSSAEEKKNFSPIIEHKERNIIWNKRHFKSNKSQTIKNKISREEKNEKNWTPTVLIELNEINHNIKTNIHSYSWPMDFYLWQIRTIRFTTRSKQWIKIQSLTFILAIGHGFFVCIWNELQHQKKNIGKQRPFTLSSSLIQTSFNWFLYMMRFVFFLNETTDVRQTV